MTETSSTPAALSRTQSGIALFAAAMFLVPIGDVLTKLLSASMSPFEVAFWRFAGQAVLLAIVLRVLRMRFAPGNLPLLALGGLTSAMTLSALIGAFAAMPLATAIAIFFVEPLILTVLSAIILKEPTGWRRFAAVGVGLLGALVVIRPNFATFGPAAILPVIAATAFAAHAVILRRVSENMTALGVQFWVAVFAVMFLAIGIVGLVGTETIQLSSLSIGTREWSFIGAAIVLSSVSFLMISEAFKRTRASTLAPFQYLEIIGATLLGYVIFGDFPDAMTWVGTAIILSAGLYVIHRERRANMQPATLDDTPTDIRD